MRIFVPRGTAIPGRRAPQRAMLDGFAPRDGGGITYAPGRRIEGVAIVVDPSPELDAYIHSREDRDEVRLGLSVYLSDKGVWTHVDVWASPDAAPAMELPLSSRFPGYSSRRIAPKAGNELQRCEILDPEARIVGEVVYLAIRRKGGGVEYGWSPSKPTSNRKVVLSTKLDAIAKLPHFIA